MKNKIRKAFVFLVFSGFFLFVANSVHASEGTVELESTTEDSFKCFAASLRMQNLEYRIPFSCRNLIYPAGENIFNYVMWATSRDKGNVFKLGTLGLGKGEFKTKTPFVDLFVTTESNKNVKSPTGKVVMRGNVQPVEFLEDEATPTPSPSAESGEEETIEEEEESVTNQEPTTREKLVLALKRAGIAALFALVALIGIIFVISRSRG